MTAKAKPQRHAPPTPATARAVAADLLREVLQRRQPLDQALERHAELGKLEARDRAFARLLAATVLRRLGQIDAVIEASLDKPLTPKARSAAQILRVGAAQLLFLSVPPHAAVGETV